MDFHRGFLTWAWPIINSSSLENGGMGHRPWSFWWLTSVLKLSRSPSRVISLEQKMFSSPRKFWGFRRSMSGTGGWDQIYTSHSVSLLYTFLLRTTAIICEQALCVGHRVMNFDMNISLNPHDNPSRVCVHAHLCLTLCDPMGCSPPVSSVCGIFQARILEWAAISICRGSSWPGIEPASLVSPACVSYVSCIERQIFYHCATWKANLLERPSLYRWRNGRFREVMSFTQSHGANTCGIRDLNLACLGHPNLTSLLST